MYAADPLLGSMLFDALAEKGITGLVVIVLLLVIRHMDRRATEREAAHKKEITEKDALLTTERETRDRLLAAERAARLEDAGKYRDGVISANERVYQVASDVVRVVEYLENMNGGHHQPPPRLQTRRSDP